MPQPLGPYTGRFAPSPTGLLHAGSLAAALASWLDARAASGRWLVRIEDVDTPRCLPGADAAILRQLADCGLHPDAPPLWQSQRGVRYQAALDQLVADGLAYPCGCSRAAIAAALAAQGIARQRNSAAPYPGTCRHGLHGQPARAWRLRTDICKQNQPLAPDKQAPIAIKNVANLLYWNDRRLGPQTQNVEATVGDFVLLRADGLWAYQLAVVVDDADQGVTHVVRGEDLTDNTARQIMLQQNLGLPTPRYLHTPLVRGPSGE
ncbi:MAG TPA: tRNA glutamyl-Q(34) synthetase GluQRS, partial [Burkholderiaceae bacterium]